MKKIPTLFKREFKGHNVAKTLPIVTEGMEWVLDGQGIATVKFDDSCCMIYNGKFFKRYDASVKKGRKVPDGAIPCQDKPDPVTGHFPCWVEIDLMNPKPEDKWFVKAYHTYLNNICTFEEMRYVISPTSPVTYEAIGQHFNGNPYDLSIDTLIPQCKIKRTDFGFEWPIK